MRRAAWALCAMACLGGCSEEDVVINGIVVDGRESIEGAAGVTVTLNEGNFLFHDETVTDEQGVFSITAPRRSFIHLVFEREGDVPIAFAGESGAADLFQVPIGQLWSFSEEEEARWRTEFAGCPDVDQPGMIVGEVRLLIPGVDLSNGDGQPIEYFGFAYVTGQDGERKDACYMNKEGTAYDPEATRVRDSGRFAIFGVEGGPWSLAVGRDTAGGTLLSTSSVYVPEGGVVSRHPALVEL